MVFLSRLVAIWVSSVVSMRIMILEIARLVYGWLKNNCIGTQYWVSVPNT